LPSPLTDQHHVGRHRAGARQRHLIREIRAVAADPGRSWAGPGSCRAP
jgi:hypothetical protein